MPGELGPSEAWLICQDQGETRRIDLSRSPVVFGRDSRCDHAFAYQGISRRHFSLERSENGWVVTDLESSNGTFINNNRVQQHTLRPGDTISIGGASKMAPVKWTFHVHAPHSSRLQLAEESSVSDHDTQFAFNMAQLERQASAGVFAPAKTPGLPPKVGSFHGEFVQEAFSEEDEPEDSFSLDSPSDVGLREFDINGAITLFSQMGQALLDSQTIDQLLVRTLDLVFRNIPAERGSIWLCDSDLEDVVCRAARTRDGKGTAKAEISKSIAFEAVNSQQALLVRQALMDGRFKQSVSVESLQIRSAMCAPLYHQGEVRGFLYVDTSSQTEGFTNDHLGVLTAMAMFIATGIEKIRSEQETVAAKNHLQSVLQSISHLVLTLDREGRLQTVNRCPLRQLGVEERLLRKHPYQEWFGEMNAGLVQLFRAVYETSQPKYLSDYEIVGDKGQTSSVNCTVVPMLDFQKNQTGLVAILEDLTREKRMATALGRYLSPTLAQRVMQEGETRLGGVRQKVTILFSDIRSYTALTESLDAQQVVELLNAYFTEMVEPVFAERGFLDKYIGDALMAVFGVPFTEDDDAIRACRTALGMHRALKQFNERQKACGLLPIRIGIGLSTGDVISGNIGSEKRLEYTCIGDGVNLANRIEGVSKIYEASTLISHFTEQELRGQFITRELDRVRVLGKQEPIQIYELVAEKLSDIPPAKQNAIELYGLGLEFYRNGEWAKASEQFHQAVELAQDGPSRILDLRCQSFLHSPPAKTWDLTWTLDQK